MKGRIGVLVTVACSLLLALPASATIPNTLHYQGYMTTDTGAPVQCVDALNCPSAPDTFGMTFRLYSSLAGGAPLWEETYPTVPVEDGLFNVILGSLLPITITLPDTVYLGITLNNEAEASPRQKVVSTAFTMRASTADNATSLGGVAASNYVETAAIPGLCVTPTQLATYEVLDVLGVDGAGNVTVNGNAAMSPTGVWLGETTVWNKSGSSVYYNGGNVGIGTAAPQNFKLVVSGDGGAAGHVAMFGSTASVGYLGVASLQTSHYIYSHDDGRFGVHVPGVGDKFTILGNGNVGIGTASPVSRLHIEDGDAKLTLRGTQSGSTANTAINFQANDGTVKWQIGSNKAIGGGLEFNAGDSTANKLYIGTGGNVGIGTGAPTNALHVSGAGNTGIRVVGSGAGFTAARLLLETTTGMNRPSGVYMFNTPAANTWYMGRQYSDDKWMVGRKAATPTLDYSTADAPNALMTLDSVGKLTVAGDLALGSVIRQGPQFTGGPTFLISDGTMQAIMVDNKIMFKLDKANDEAVIDGDLKVSGTITQNGVPVGGGGGGSVMYLKLAMPDWPSYCPWAYGWNEADITTVDSGADGNQNKVRTCWNEASCIVLQLESGATAGDVNVCPAGFNQASHGWVWVGDATLVRRTCFKCP